MDSNGPLWKSKRALFLLKETLISCNPVLLGIKVNGPHVAHVAQGCQLPGSSLVSDEAALGDLLHLHRVPSIAKELDDLALLRRKPAHLLLVIGREFVECTRQRGPPTENGTSAITCPPHCQRCTTVWPSKPASSVK